MKRVPAFTFHVSRFTSMLRIHLFGHLRLFYDDQPLKFAALPKTLPLWAYLLLNRAKPIPRDSLAFTLWPDVSESEARANLRRHLHELRRVLPTSPIPWITNQGNTLQWNPQAPFWLDIAEFDRLAASPAHLVEAVPLYDGDLLQDIYDEDWLFFERERLRNLFFASLSQLVAHHRLQQEYPQAIQYALQLLSHDPMREDMMRELLTLRYESGDRAGAIQEYHRFEQRLEEELGVKPMPETRHTYEQIVKNLPLAGAKPKGDTGKSKVEEKVVAKTAVSPHNIPAQLTTFIGREAELRQMKGLIGTADSTTRLLTLIGPGGTGKTRLSIETATQLVKNTADLFPDGLWFVPLAAVTDPHFVLSAIAEVLKVPENANESLLQTLQTFLRPKKIFLILDNFEQVVEAAPLITDLLSVAPGLRVLVTSRILLNVYGEQTFAVPPLPLPELDNLPQTADLLNYAAIALFVERTTAVQPTFKLTDENGRIIVEICLRLDGLPLAIELAAARSKLFNPPALLSQLSNRLQFLVGQSRNLSVRQQTLRNTIDWSYNLLRDEEKQVFTYLSIFAGVFTLEAAQAVISQHPTTEIDYELLTILTSLVEQSIIRQLPTPEASPQPHFRLLFTLREYAQEKLLHTGKADELHLRHAHYYLSLTQAARKEWGSPTQADWMERLKTAEDNLRATLIWCLRPDATAETALLAAQMALSLRPVWHTRGQMNEAYDWYNRILPHRTTFPPEIQVPLLHATSWQAVLRDNYTFADPLLQEALQLSHSLEDTALIADSLAYLGSMTARQQNYQLAVQYLTQTVELDRQIPGDNSYNLSASLSNLAVAYRRLHNDEKATQLWQEALHLARTSGNRLREADVLENLAELAVLHGNYAQANDFLRQGIPIRQAMDSKIGLMNSLRVMGHLAFATKAYERTVCLYTASEAMRHAINITEMPDVLNQMTKHLVQIRQQLGEAAFEAARAKGQTMTLDEAVSYALQTEKSQ